MGKNLRRTRSPKYHLNDLRIWNDAKKRDECQLKLWTMKWVQHFIECQYSSDGGCKMKNICWQGTKDQYSAQPAYEYKGLCQEIVAMAVEKLTVEKRKLET